MCIVYRASTLPYSWHSDRTSCVINISKMKSSYIGITLLLIISACECVYIYSSFWAPLFNPKILNYRVDATFDPEAGKKYRDNYERKYGVRGEKLIADLGNGKGPSEFPLNEDIGAVKFYYTYPGAQQRNSINNIT